MVEYVCFRLANYETPLWAVANFTAGRYNHAGVGTTQYLSLHPMTPWAEVLRNENRRTRDEAIAMRYPLWSIRVALADEPLALTFDSAQNYGLDPADLVADDQAACRALADAFRAGGPSSFIAPSAALPGTQNLIVLEPRVVVGYLIEPFDEIDWPTALASQGGRCPEGLWDVVHFTGAETRHAALDAWQQGEDVTFVELEVTAESLAA